MPVTAISSYAQFKKVIAEESPCIIDFWATWCGPCRAISPVLENLSDQSEYSEHLRFYKVDVDEQDEIAQEVNIRAMPTFMIFSKGEKLEEFLGAHPAALTSLVKRGVEESKKLKA